MNKMLITYVQFVAAIFIFSGIAFYGFEKKAGVDTTSATISAPSSAVASTSVELKIDEEGLHPKSEQLAHQTHPLVKPGAAVGLKNTDIFHVAAPGLFDYPLELTSSSQTGAMTVVVSASDGIALVSPQHQFDFILQEQGEYILPLTLNAAREGRFYIQLHITIATAEQSSSRVIAAIVQVGEPAIKAQKAATMSSAKEVNHVISLPAQETISPQ